MKQRGGSSDGQSAPPDGGRDFFVFRDQSWMVPLTFDDKQGKSAIIEVRIQFEKPLRTEFDIIWTKLPYHELELNSYTKGSENDNSGRPA